MRCSLLVFTIYQFMCGNFVLLSDGRMATVHWAESRKGNLGKKIVTTTTHVNLKNQTHGGPGGLVSYEDLLIAQYLDELRHERKKRTSAEYVFCMFLFTDTTETTDLYRWHKILWENKFWHFDIFLTLLYHFHSSCFIMLIQMFWLRHHHQMFKTEQYLLIDL